MGAPRMKLAKATMADVARLAGVSAATVARVLYSNGYVNAQTRAVVEAAIIDTGYRPNVMARALRTARSFTIGLVVSESRLNAFHPYVAHEVQLEALKHGYTVLTLNNRQSPAIEHAGVQRFLDQHVDAIVFCAAIDPDNVRATSAAGIPTVQIERRIADLGSMVLVDPQPGMGAAVNHLAELGHRRIAYIGGDLSICHREEPDGQSVEALRLQSFERAMDAVGLPVPDGFIHLGPYYAENSARQPGYVHMRKLLDAPDPPTAVIAGADLLAAGALQAIAERGLSVPRDISLIGFDNTMAEVLTPPLTSIAQPIVQLGHRAVALALDAINAPDAPPRIETFATYLVLRQSTAAPRP